MVDKRTIGLISVCVVLLAVCSLTSILFTQNLNELQLKSDTLSQIQNDKATLESQVSSLDSQLASSNTEKAELESQVSELQSKLSASETDKTALNSQISSLQSNVASLRNEVTQSYNNGYDKGKAEGYQDGVVDGAGSGYNIRDPTYSEAMAFISSDQTDKNDYTEDYVCWNFVADFKSNAFDAGLKAGFVYIAFPEFAHAITCFNTVDNGLIFIEPQSDAIVSLSIGEVYWNRAIYEPPSYNDTVVEYAIIW
jgi:regulator of replication initiation timing